MQAGAREAAGLIEQLCEAAEAARRAITRHMAAEEAALLPALHAHLCPAQQRALVWGSLRAMPLRLLERVTALGCRYTPRFFASASSGATESAN